MNDSKHLGGVIHTYQKYDPKNFPSPTQPPPDLVSPAFEHMLMYGNMRELTDEELARAVHLDPSQIAGLGPSLDALRAMLLERKRKILEKYETEKVVRRRQARRTRSKASRSKPPRQAGASGSAKLSRRAASRPGAALVRRRRRPLAVRPRPGAARRAAGRQVPGRRAGRRSTSSPAARR